jgi:hypothetical protein
VDDRTAVIDTVNRYATALDTRDWALLDEVFTPDVLGDYGAGVLKGRDALRGMVRHMLGGTGPSQHLLANHRVDLEGDSARCICLVRAFSAGAGSTAGQSYELIGEYRDELVRTPEGWMIARRQMAVHHEIGSRDILGP